MRRFVAHFITTLVVGMALGRSVSGQVPVDTLRILGDIAGHVTRIGRIRGDSIWPGFRPDTIPYAFVLPSRGTALFNWSGRLPNGFVEVPGIRNSGWQPQTALGAASTGTNLDGRPVAQVVVTRLDATQLISTAIHEAFHVFEGASVKPGSRFGRGENSFYVSSYPIFDARSEMLFAREGELLAQALRARARARQLEIARQFVAVRRERHRLLDDTYAQFDRASEMNEGLAQYALIRALQSMTTDRQIPGAWRDLARQRLVEEDVRLNALTRDVTQSFRLRYYSTGPAEAQLLDRLGGPGWKHDMMQRNESIQDALARVVGFDALEEGALRQATPAADTSRLAQSARAAISRLVALRARQVDSVLAMPGVLVELSASQLPAKDFGMCGFDPQNHLQVSPTIQLQTRWWRPCSGKALSSEFNVPSVHDAKAGSIRAVIGAESEVRVTVAGKPVSLADGDRVDAATDVRVDAPKANIQSARANLVRAGRTLRITPLPDP